MLGMGLQSGAKIEPRASVVPVSPRLHKNSIEWLPDLIAGTARGFDAIVLISAATVAYVVYFDGGLLFDIESPTSDGFRQLYHVLVFSAVILQLNVFHLCGLYRFEHLSNVSWQLGRSVVAATILFLVLLTVLYLVKVSNLYSRGWMILWYALTAGGVAAIRLMMCPAAQWWIKEGHVARHVAIIGDGRPAERLENYLTNLRSVPIDFAGKFDDRLAPRDGLGSPPVGTIDELCELARTQEIDQIILAMPRVSDKRLASILLKMRSLPVDVRLCRDTLDYCLPQSSYEFCGIVPLLRLYDKPVSGWAEFAKSMEDKLLAGTMLLLLSPVLFAIALLIKLDSPGPAFFKQQRYGFNNRIITVWKFRTMYHNQTDQHGARQVTEDDPRVTRVGQILRKWSLDELPQLINVLLGDMSVVGPRPHPLMCSVAGRLFGEVVEEYAARHRVKPGITGWAQVHGWYGAADTDEKIRQRVTHDLYYIDNWSIFLDLRILLMTLYVVLKRESL
jgi:Undecaprenyl-phosphate glucose phosphotransferase